MQGLYGACVRRRRSQIAARRAFCNAEGQPLLPLHATQAAQYRLERAMRMFYRTSFTHHRYASTWDPTIDSLDRALTRCESNLSVARSARSDESGGSAFGAAVDYGELPFLEGPQTEDRAAEAAQFGASCARNDANARDEAACAELARILQNLGSTERLYMDLRCVRADSLPGWCRASWSCRPHQLCPIIAATLHRNAVRVQNRLLRPGTMKRKKTRGRME